MLSKNLFIQPVSRFIALAPGGNPLTAPSPVPAEVAEASAAEGGWAGGVNTRRTWQSPAGAGVRHVEMAILASVCAYFAFGLGSTLGLY